MPPKFPPPQLTIGTRSQNKNVHPGKPVVDARQSRCSNQEMQEVRAQEAQEAEEEKSHLVNSLKTVAQIEDELLREDVQRRTSNHQSQRITPFNPHLRAMGSDVAAPRTGHKSTECGLSSLIIRKHILTVLGDDTAHNTADDEEGSEGSQDEFHPPPPCEDGKDSLSDGESEVPDESEKEATTKKSGPKMGKKPKPGCKDVIAMRESTAQKPTPTSTEDRLKRKANDATRWVSICMSKIHLSLITNYRASEHQTGTKKSKKSNRPPSGLLPGWDHNQSQSTSAAPPAGKDIVSAEDDSMVQYGGLLEDGEDDAIEQAAVHKSTFNGGIGKKAMVRSRYHYFEFIGSITV